jgi:hypothetical protein
VHDLPETLPPEEFGTAVLEDGTLLLNIWIDGGERRVILTEEFMLGSLSSAIAPTKASKRNLLLGIHADAEYTYRTSGEAVPIVLT